MRNGLLYSRIIVQNRLFGDQENVISIAMPGVPSTKACEACKRVKKKVCVKSRRIGQLHRAPSDSDSGFYAVRLTTAEVFAMFTSPYFLPGLWSAKV